MLNTSDKTLNEHYNRLYKAIFNTYDLKDASRWIQDYTYLNGDRFSFKDHEYQEEILNDTSRIVNVQKCAQIGMSELMSRYILALCKIMPHFSAILTFPYSGDAENFMKTRISRVIAESPELKSSLTNIDNNEIKEIGNSLLYARGTSGTTQAISIPADILVHDELDKSDKAIIGQYQSRIRHSKWKLVRKFSTPTLAKRGISAEMDISRRKYRLCKCVSCNHWYWPQYYEHVKIPDYDGDLLEITKDSLRQLRWREAQILCPRCSAVADLSAPNREWVFQNENDNFEAIGYQCSPFDVPAMTTTPELVKESTAYESHGEFMNQALGLVATNDNTQLTEANIRDCLESLTDLNSSNVHCMGADMGLTCYIKIGRMVDGLLLDVHSETCSMQDFERRKLELQRQYRVVITICDSQPYVDMILRMQRIDKNLYGGVYVTSKALKEYEIKMVDKEDAKGKLPINQANINRDVVFDQIMNLFKSKAIRWRPKDEHQEQMMIEHWTDMKREQIFDKNQELTYTWTKSGKGIDHFHHALLYMYVACRLMPTMNRTLPLGGDSGVPLLGKFAVKANKVEDTKINRVN